MQPKYKIGICKKCNKEKLIYQKSKCLCFYCNQRESFLRTQERKKKKGTLIDYTRLNKFYDDFYNSHTTKRCFETNVNIINYKPWNCHHVLEKKIHPTLMFNTDVCVLLTLEQHSLWHGLNDEDKAIKMPNTWNKFLQLKQQYNV